jgi:hypothetical protein
MSMEACMLSWLWGVLEHPKHPPPWAELTYSYTEFILIERKLKNNYKFVQFFGIDGHSLH